MNRRQLLKSAGLTAAMRTVGAGQSARAAANDRVGLGVIGCGSQGTWDQKAFMSLSDVEIVALCDVYRPNLEKNLQLAGGKAKTYRDYRRLLEDRDVQAVLIATPEHWHAYMTIDACDAGKDVYCEKPASHNIRDGRLAVEAARRNNQIVEVGSQQRSGSHFQRAVKYVQDGRIGDVHYALCWGHAAPSVEAQEAAAPPASATPPADLDYDFWLGPAPFHPFAEVWPRNRNRFWDFYGGYLTEWGAHLTDIVLWALQAQGLRTVQAAGAQYRNQDTEMPDTLQVLYEYPSFIFQFSVLSHNSWGPNGDPGAGRWGSYGIQFQGTKGTLFVDRAGFRLSPQFVRRPDRNHPPRPVEWHNDDRELGYYYTTETFPEYADASVQLPAHARNFIDSVKSRKRPIADVEDGHYTNTVNRLGNIAYRLGRKLRWDAAREQVVDDPEANRLVVGAYRAPWIPKGL
jgi:predicted dehydrogenase